MARASRIFIFCLLMIVGTEATKLRKLHARAHTAHKMHDNLRFKKKSVYKFGIPGDTATGGGGGGGPPPPLTPGVQEKEKIL